jgi:hypothetical protein
VCGDWAHGPLSVTVLGRNGKGSLLADTHIQKTIIPSKLYASASINPSATSSSRKYSPFDNLSLANHKAQGCSSLVASIELGSIRSQSSLVMDRYLVSLLGLALAFYRVGDFDFDILSEDGARTGCQGGEGDGEETHGGQLTAIGILVSKSLGIENEEERLSG